MAQTYISTPWKLVFGYCRCALCNNLLTSPTVFAPIIQYLMPKYAYNEGASPLGPGNIAAPISQKKVIF